MLGVTIAVRAREHRSRRRVISSRCWPAPPAISPLLVLFAVFFWSFLWETPGAFIGVPATIAMLTMCAQYAGSCWLAVLLSDSASRK